MLLLIQKLITLFDNLIKKINIYMNVWQDYFVGSVYLALVNSGRASTSCCYIYDRCIKQISWNLMESIY